MRRPREASSAASGRHSLRRTAASMAQAKSREASSGAPRITSARPRAARAFVRGVLLQEAVQAGQGPLRPACLDLQLPHAEVDHPQVRGQSAGGFVIMERSAKVSMSPMHLAAPDEEACIRRVGFDPLRQVGDCRSRAAWAAAFRTGTTQRTMQETKTTATTRPSPNRRNSAMQCPLSGSVAVDP